MGVRGFNPLPEGCGEVEPPPKGIHPAMHTGPTAIYVLTPQGIQAAEKLRSLPDVQVYASASLCRAHPEFTARPFERLPELVGERFHTCPAHIFIGAAGIAVRCIAPHLAGKDRDPAVLVVAPTVSFVVSLLSGHLGGANALTLRVAELLGAQPVITTASDSLGLPAVDLLAQEKGLIIVDLAQAKYIAAALVAGEPVFLDDPENRLGLAGSPHAGLFRPAPPEPLADNPPTVRVTFRPMPERQRQLLLHPPVFAGVGCRRGTPEKDILAVLEDALKQADVAPKALAGLASVTLKQDEPGLLRAAERLHLPLRFFTPEELAGFPVATPSPKAQEVLGIPGVCEAAALAAAGPEGRLILGKLAVRNVTVALAERGSKQNCGSRPGGAPGM